MSRHLWLLALSVLILLAFLLVGCQREQSMPPPKTIEEGKAFAALQSELILAKGKVATMESLDKFKIMCAIGFVGSVFAVVLGAKTFGVAGLIASLSGFALAYAGSEYAKFLGWIGLLLGAAAGIYAMYMITTALKQVIAGNEKFKKTVDGTTVEKFKLSQEGEQTRTTKTIVDKVQQKVNNIVSKIK